VLEVLGAPARLAEIGVDPGAMSLTAVYITTMVIIGILVALFLALRNTDSRDRADVIRAVAELFRWFRWRR
jgi:hypothetical protein